MSSEKVNCLTCNIKGPSISVEMPRRRTIKTPPQDRRSDVDDDDFFFDDTHSSSGRSSQEPPHRNAANARERARMRVLSKAFCRLKTTLPWVPADTKLSKLDTLRLAASYIAHLRALLHEPRSARAPHPLSLGWPFAFQQGGSLSCTLSQRWNINHGQQNHCQFNRHSQNIREIHNSMNNNDFYTQEFENDYEERYEDITQNESCASHSCNYGYKEDSCYDMRDSHATQIGNN